MKTPGYRVRQLERNMAWQPVRDAIDSARSWDALVEYLDVDWLPPEYKREAEAQSVMAWERAHLAFRRFRKNRRPLKRHTPPATRPRTGPLVNMLPPLSAQARRDLDQRPSSSA